MPDNTSDVGATFAKNPNNVKHLALLVGTSEPISDLTAALQYKGLAVVGASPVSTDGGSDPEGLTEYLSQMSKTVLKNSEITTVHILQFPGSGVDSHSIIEAISSEYKDVEVCQVPIETERGARAYFEEAHNLVPEEEGDGETSDQDHLRDMLSNPSFRQILTEEADKLHKEAGIPAHEETFTLSPDSGDTDQDTSLGLEREEPKTLAEAKIFLEQRNDSLSKEVTTLSEDNRDLRMRVASLEDRVTGLLRILDNITKAFGQ